MRCPHLRVKNYGDEGMGFCELTERPSGRIQQCVLEGYDKCGTWEEIKAEWEKETACPKKTLGDVLISMANIPERIKETKEGK